MLPWHEGKCKNLHGHNYILTVFLEIARGALTNNGIVKDYYDVTKEVNEAIIDKFDHKYLNDFYPNPTAELLAMDFLIRLRIVSKIYTKVILQETENTTAEVAISDL